MSFFSKFARSLAEYGDDNWSPEEIAEIIANANTGREPDNTDLTWLQPKTSLLPPRLLTELDETAVLRRVPKTEFAPLRALEGKEEISAMAKILSGDFIDEEFQLIFKPRTTVDLGIRRARASTVFRLYKSAKREAEWTTWLPRLVNLDYITTCNLMLGEFIHTKWLYFWSRAKALRSMDDWQLVSKAVSDMLKKSPTTMTMRLRYCEASGLSGYRNPPFQNFDFIAETKKLAEGGEEHGIVGEDWIEEFKNAATAVRGGSIAKSVEWMTLEDFIASDLATTGGASTWGKVEWEFEGEKGKFKARKNFLLDITTPEFLAKETRANLGKQVNKSFIKSELGKMRIAVTGDIWSYFSQAWLNYLAGGVYLSWPGNTLDEKIGQQTKRMSAMLSALDGQYGLPFDFAAFDHQPQTIEVVELADQFLSCGEYNVPTSQRDDWFDVKSRTLESFRNAELVAHDKGQEYIFPIEGGVQSGIRLTSLLGNYWNSVMTEIAKVMVRRLGYEGPLPSWLRGDDSAIYGENYWVVLIMRLAYAAINAVGNDSKYGIHFQNSEFLRIWYSKERCYGYPNRAIPGIMQRKPWSSEPWDPEGVVKAQLDTVNIIQRRTGVSQDDLRREVVRDWTRIRKQTSRWLELPVTLGGLGLLPFRGWTSSIAWPKVEHPNIIFSNIDSESYTLIQEKMEVWKLSASEAKEIQQKRMVAKAASDDIRGLGKTFRDQYKLELAQMKDIVWTKPVPKVFPTDGLSAGANDLRSLSTTNGLERVIEQVGTGFGSGHKAQQFWTEAQEVSTVRKMAPMNMLRDKFPDVYSDVRRLERKGLHRAAALDYIFGNIAGLVVGDLHPLLSSLVQSSLSCVVDRWCQSDQKWSRYTWGWFTSNIAQWYASELAQSPLSNALFMW